MSVDTLQNIPVAFREIYRKHWNTIKTRVTKGRIKDVYHFPLLTVENNEIISRLQEVLTNYNRSRIKINVSFGFILKNRTTKELKFFHPSNNTMVFSGPRPLGTPTDYQLLINDLEQEDAFEYARLQRPTTNWTVERIVCIRFDVTNLFNLFS
jgi:hypothetical protein